LVLLSVWDWRNLLGIDVGIKQPMRMDIAMLISLFIDISKNDENGNPSHAIGWVTKSK
jgi:hypothetical protein